MNKIKRFGAESVPSGQEQTAPFLPCHKVSMLLCPVYTHIHSHTHLTDKLQCSKQGRIRPGAELNAVREELSLSAFLKMSTVFCYLSPQALLLHLKQLYNSKHFLKTFNFSIKFSFFFIFTLKTPIPKLHLGIFFHNFLLILCHIPLEQMLFHYK